MLKKSMESMEESFQARQSYSSIQSEKLYSSAGVVRKFSAFLVDSIILGGIFLLFIIMLPLSWKPFSQQTFGFSIDGFLEFVLSNQPTARILLFFLLILVFFYFLFFHLLTGQTVGKKLFRIRLIDEYGEIPSLGRLLIRLLGSFLSFVFLMAGFLWVFIDGQRRSWSDMIAGTYVILQEKKTRKDLEKKQR